MSLIEQAASEWRQARNFAELVAAVSAAEDGCFDEIARLESMAYGPDDTLRYAGATDAASLFPGAIAEDVARFTVHSLAQFAERLGAPPMRWLKHPDKCSPELRADVVNAVIRHREDKSLLLRRKGDALRAVLSDDYSVFNHSDFLDLIGGAISRLGQLGEDVRVHNAAVGDELRGYMVFPHVVYAADPGGVRAISGGSVDMLPTPETQTAGGTPVINPSIYVSNSEIGTGKVRICGAVYRQICSNGLMAWSKEDGGLELVHRGLSKRTIASAVADALVKALRMSESLADAFIASQAVLVQPGLVEDLAREWGDKYGLALDSIDDWHRMVAFEARQNGRSVGDVTLFDVVNAATYAAHELEPAEREQVERMAGDMVEHDFSRSRYVRDRGVGDGS